MGRGSSFVRLPVLEVGGWGSSGVALEGLPYLKPCCWECPPLREPWSSSHSLGANSGCHSILQLSIPLSLVPHASVGCWLSLPSYAIQLLTLALCSQPQQPFLSLYGLDCSRYASFMVMTSLFTRNYWWPHNMLNTVSKVYLQRGSFIWTTQRFIFKFWFQSWSILQLKIRY